MGNVTLKTKDTGPLDWRIAIVDKTGRPTPEFQRRWSTQRTNNSLIGFVGVGSGAPTGTPAGDGEVYIDISATPWTLWAADNGAWQKVGVYQFTQLSDVPGNYSGAGDKLVRVNAGATGLEFDSLSAVLDGLSPVQGSIIFRGSAGWEALLAGTDGDVLITHGNTSDPTWGNVTGNITSYSLEIEGNSTLVETNPSVLDFVGAGVGVTTSSGNVTVTIPGTTSSGADPTATASDTAVNGTATTFMRSDGAPAVQKASSSVFGIVKVDGVTITETSGVISSSGGGGGGVGGVPLVNTDLSPTGVMSDNIGQTIAVPLGNTTAGSAITNYMAAGNYSAIPGSPNLSPNASSFYLATDTSKAYVWTGSGWLELNP